MFPYADLTGLLRHSTDSRRLKITTAPKTDAPKTERRERDHRSLQLLLGGKLVAEKKKTKNLHRSASQQQPPEPRTAHKLPPPPPSVTTGLLARVVAAVLVITPARQDAVVVVLFHKTSQAALLVQAWPGWLPSSRSIPTAHHQSLFDIANCSHRALNRLFLSMRAGERGTMRSGLQTPGVIPLLALVVFALLSVVPTALTAWESSSARPNWLAYHANDLPRALRDLAASNPTQRWLIPQTPGSGMEDDASILDVDPSVQAFCIGDGYDGFSRDSILSPRPKYRLPQVAVSESTDSSPLVAAETMKQDLVEDATDSVTVFSGTLRSLKTFVSHDAKDSRLRHLLPGRNMLSSVFSAVANSSHQGALTDRTRSTSWATGSKLDGNRLISSLSFPVSLCETWQQVCHLGVNAWGDWHRSALLAIFNGWIGSSKKNSAHHESLGKSQFTVPRQTEGSVLRSQSSTYDETAHPLSKASKTHLFDASTLTLPPSTSPTDQPNVAAGASTSPKEMRGSCMAIVIGLVVGIMWF
ncbi:hypothetical protein DTO271G3_6888 [Paecilomyces variotii]|nr:hypothetical protein DTO271G3_6888 [Paecilomyces variotii]